MPDELGNVIPAPEGGAETPVEGQTPESTEFNVETSDNVKQLREYAKSLKTDLDVYKPSHEFLEQSFGGKSNAELAASFYGSFAGDEFDTDKFFETISQLSPQRAKQLTDKLSQTEASKLAQTEIEKLFGSKPTNEEIRLFKEWKESGYGLGTGEDIPDALKFNVDGTPRTDEEIQFYRDLQRQIKENAAAKEAENQQKANEAEVARMTKIQDDINEFSEGRLKILEKEFDNLGLGYKETDTADQRVEKDFMKSFLLDGIAGAFMKDVNASKDYNAAIKHIQDGESLLARKYETRIEAKLLEICRNKFVGKLLQSLTQTTDPTSEIRPEIDEAGTPNTDQTTPKGRTSADDIIKGLVERGAIKL